MFLLGEYSSLPGHVRQDWTVYWKENTVVRQESCTA